MYWELTMSDKKRNLVLTEGVLSIPLEYVDESINIFRFPNELSLILTRALLPEEQTLDIYINEQINTLRKGVKNF